MSRIAIIAGALALVSGWAFAAATDYRFELVGQPRGAGPKTIVQIRLVRVADGKPVPDAIIFDTKADMAPSGMAEMVSPLKPIAAKNGVYDFAVEPGMTGTWALHLAAKIQGETETVRGTVDTDLLAH